jgi:hypothetical protein
MQDRHSSRADSFFPGYTLFSVGGMAQGGEWSGQLLLEGRLILSRLHLVWCRRNGPGWGVVQLTIRDSYSSRADSFSPGYTLFSVGRMAQGGE